MGDLKVARRNLIDALGDRISQYWTVVKNWYRQKLTKEEFDSEARKLLPSDQIKFHNDFVVSLLTKCNLLSMSSENGDSKPQSVGLSMPGKQKKSKPQKKKKVVTRPTFERRFVPADPMLYIPTDLCVPGSGGAMEFCSQSACLPDVTVLHGRILVTAWEWNLEKVQDKVVWLMNHAVEHVLKNVISSTLSRRSGYQLRNRCFKHSMGKHSHVPSLPFTLKNFASNSNNCLTCEQSSEQASLTSSYPTYDQSEQEAVLHLVTTGQPPDLGPVTLDELLEALQVNKWVLRSHMVSTGTIERTLCERWHPDHDELKQDMVWRQHLDRSEAEYIQK